MKCKYCGQMMIPGKNYCVGCGEKDPVMVLSLQVETLERDRAHRMTRTIKKTKLNLLLLSIISFFVSIPFLFGTWVWIYRSGWDKDFFLYMEQQGYNGDTLISMLLAFIYVLIPIVVLLVILIRSQLRSLRGYQDECEHLGLKRNGEYIEKEEN